MLFFSAQVKGLPFVLYALCGIMRLHREGIPSQWSQHGVHFAGDNKGIPRMPCVICTACLRKVCPGPSSPHCWFSGTHPPPWSHKWRQSFVWGGVEQIYCGWSPHKRPRRCHNRTRISCCRFHTVWFKCLLHMTTDADTTSVLALRPRTWTTATQWDVSPLYVWL